MSNHFNQFGILSHYSSSCFIPSSSKDPRGL